MYVVLLHPKDEVSSDTLLRSIAVLICCLYNYGEDGCTTTTTTITATATTTTTAAAAANNNNYYYYSVQFSGYLLTCRLNSTSAYYRTSAKTQIKHKNSTNTQKQNTK